MQELQQAYEATLRIVLKRPWCCSTREIFIGVGVNAHQDVFFSISIIVTSPASGTALFLPRCPQIGGKPFLSP